ncbi:MAG: hypothetical protein IPO95_08725 [Rhodanobacteraceae bacterium]|nr:hypothetical protein [Rhodanobacteraceae bacterium]
MAIAGAERALQQGAEDRRLDVFPVGPRRLDQQVELGRVQRQRVRRLEQLAVEAQHLVRQHRREPAGIHVAPQLRQHAHRHVRALAMRRQQVAETVCGQQAHVLGEHREQAAHEELRHRFRCAPAPAPATSRVPPAGPRFRASLGRIRDSGRATAAR